MCSHCPKDACICQELDNLFEFSQLIDTLVRSVTQWNEACDKGMPILLSYINKTRNYSNSVNRNEDCHLGLFQGASFAGDLRDSNSTSGGSLCVFGSHKFVSISGVCKKQTADFSQQRRV